MSYTPTKTKTTYLVPPYTINSAEYSSAPPPWTPTTPSAPLTVWFNPTSGLTINQAAGSGSWTNLGTSGGGLTLYNPQNTTENGIATVSFAGGNGNAASYNPSSQARGVFFVLRNTFAFVAGTPIYIFGNSSPPGAMSIRIATTGAANKQSISFLQQNTVVQNTATFNANQQTLPAAFGCFQSASSTANSKAQYNGTTVGFSTNNPASGYVNTAVNALNALQPGGPANPLTIHYCEVLIYDGELTSTDFDNIMTYLRNRWGTG